MFDLLTRSGAQHENNRKLNSGIEPHVSAFRMSDKVADRFSSPFEWMTYCLAAMILSAILFWMWTDSTLLIEVSIGTLLVIAPFYFLGLIYSLRYYYREQNTQVEIDHKHCLIQYKNRRKNLLFRFDQVRRCDVTISSLLPNSLEYTSIRLEGDIDIHISNLIVDPAEIVALFAAPYGVHRKLFNRLPVT